MLLFLPRASGDLARTNKKGYILLRCFQEANQIQSMKVTSKLGYRTMFSYLRIQGKEAMTVTRVWGRGIEGYEQVVGEFRRDNSTSFAEGYTLDSVLEIIDSGIPHREEGQFSYRSDYHLSFYRKDQIRPIVGLIRNFERR